MVEQDIATSTAWPAGDLPMKRWTRCRSRELGEIHRHMVAAFCPHDLATEGGPPISFRHNRVDLGSSSFNATDYGLPFGRVAVSIPPAEHSFLVQFVIEGRAHFRHQGEKFVLEPGNVAVISPHDATEQISEAGCKHFTIKLDRRKIEALLLDDLGPTRKRLIFAPTPVRMAGMAGTFVNFVRAIVEEMEGGAPAYTHHRTIGATEAMLGRLLLGAVPHSQSFDYEYGEASSAAPYYVMKTEEFIRSAYKERLTLSDLIEASGVSARSLSSGFRRFRDDTPMGWLKRYRLERAREMLEHALPDELTVTQVALTTGFSNPGKFSQDYSARYSEAPSATLRRRPIRKS